MMATSTKNPARLAANLRFGENLTLIACTLAVNPFQWISEIMRQALPLWQKKNFGTFQPGFDRAEVSLF